MNAGRGGREIYPLPTVYNIDYRWPLHPVPREKTGFEPVQTPRPVRKYSEAEAEALLENLYKSRLRTTYDVSYTFPISKRLSMGELRDFLIFISHVKGDEVGEEQDKPEKISDQNNMLNQFKLTYGEESCQRPRPQLPTARKLFGKARSPQLLVGRSEYQDCLGRLGYCILLEREKSTIEKKK
ncbi:hypothetical protein J437_LFUL002242 [Ladona fulva]|uniref:Uncharacterized protein n=1 Tax=Ladona fulva TaxID=123851 RepID=A0A8K0NX01_LADFU|nr:hypothetical protein J437_LFUL002242 [Ladona fulva]